MNYKVTQEGNIQGVEPIYNRAEVSEEQLRNKVAEYLEPYFRLMDEVWNEGGLIDKVMRDKYFFYEDIAFGSNIEIIIEEV